MSQPALHYLKEIDRLETRMKPRVQVFIAEKNPNLEMESKWLEGQKFSESPKPFKEGRLFSK